MSLIARQRLIEDIEDHCVLYLPLWEGVGTKAKDMSPLNLDATVNGAGWVNGPIGKALSFNGVTDYARTANLPAFQNEISISAWIYPTDGSYHQDIIDLSLASGWLICYAAGSTVAVTIDYIGSVAGIDIATWALAPLNKWTHVVGMIERSGDDAILKIYENGVLKGTTTFPEYVWQPDPAPTPLLDASYVELSPNTLLPTWGRFKGYLSEVRIYDVALSASEVFEEYYRGARMSY